MTIALNHYPASSFEQKLSVLGAMPLRAIEVATLQVNLGKRCNQACHHCHVDAGPQRTEEMTADTVELVLEALRTHRIPTLDITGGAPEINTHFRHLVSGAREHCERIIDRSNLTILFEPGQEDLPQFLVEHRVEIMASLPCYLPDNVDRQRGLGVFDKSIEALQLLNKLGYGRAGGELALNLVYNPVGMGLPRSQVELEEDYKRELEARFGIKFSRLFTITNMPISRFKHDLERTGRLDEYMSLLEQSFNGHTVAGLMCRSLVSVSWDGRLFDCDFNQMLDLPVNDDMPQHIREFDRFLLARRAIRTAAHCFGCTAGSGSSCTGAVVS